MQARGYKEMSSILGFFIGRPKRALVLSYMGPNAGGEGGRSREVSANEYSCTHETQINFGDLTPYLTYGCKKSDSLCNGLWKKNLNTFFLKKASTVLSKT